MTASLIMIFRRYLVAGSLLFVIPSILLGSHITAAQTQNPLNNISIFLTASGWSAADKIQSAIGTGVIDNGDGVQHSITIKVDRKGRFRSDIPDLRVSTVAVRAGSVTQIDGVTYSFDAAAATQLGSSALIPIFTPLAEVSNPRVSMALYSSDQRLTRISIAKLWNQQDGFDTLRQKSGLYVATFDNTNHSLVSIEYTIASQYKMPSNPTEKLVYSDFRVVSGIALPFTISEFVNDKPSSILRLNEILLNVPFSDSEFALPQVTK